MAPSAQRPSSGLNDTAQPQLRGGRPLAHGRDHDLMRIPVPRTLHANDNATAPAAPRYELRALEALIPAKSEHVARREFDYAGDAACLHVRKHPLWGSKTHSFIHPEGLNGVLPSVITPAHSPSCRSTSKPRARARRPWPLSLRPYVRVRTRAHPRSPSSPLVAGSPSALPRRGPLRTGRASFPASGSSKP